MNDNLKLAIEHWPFVAPLLRKPQNEDDYDFLVEIIDQLLHITGEDEDHPLNGLLEIISDWVETYDLECRRMPEHND
ncbi:hypothetical protein NUV89_25640 [Pseudomonas sp. 18.1.10]|uniref:hypothetical protein n=1 Tax=Pseudomonas sp. 18.1.10 TaxID=2969302 RepID=UPI00214FE445|nr:hypothetical protein [Pseudomonas sp. 18.1.10]MCR4541788.1 hypothetical protein [Pseudomonas sp. 18.1.10]